MKEKENVVSAGLELGNPEIESKRATTALKLHWWMWGKKFCIVMIQEKTENFLIISVFMAGCRKNPKQKGDS